MGSSNDPIITDALIVGAGFSGIANLHRMRQLGLTATIFEASSDFGGTWNYNRYPGARVDSEFPFYQLTIPEVWKTWNWSERFPSYGELRRYFAHVDKVLNVSRDTVFDAKVVNAEWDGEKARWRVTTARGNVAEAKYLIIAGGLLHKPYAPTFPGMDRYNNNNNKGAAIFHSASWPDDAADLTGKKVAIIGCGATGVQLVQELSKQVSQLTVFMRRPSYCAPMQNRPLSVAEQNSWRAYYPKLFEAGRQSPYGFPLTSPGNSIWAVSPKEREEHFEEAWTRGGFNFTSNQYADCFTDKEANKLLYEFWAKKVRARMSDPIKAELMAPREMPYFFLTTRPPLEQDYYECLDRKNVEIVDLNNNPIIEFSEKGIVSKDAEREFDVVVLATGFDSYTGSITNMGIKNTSGKDLKDIWKDGIRTYLGLMIHGFPNLFLTYSPQSPGPLGNGVTIIEGQADLTKTAISNLESSKLRFAEPTPESMEEWYRLIQTMNATTLLRLTPSWWNTANIPGKKAEMVTWVWGSAEYERQCHEKLEGWKGFVVG